MNQPTSMPMDDAATEARHRRFIPLAWRFAPLAILVLGLVAGYAVGLEDQLSLQAIAHSRASLMAALGGSEALAVLVFSALCVPLTAFGFPPSVLAVIGGFLFGWIAATLSVVAGATAGATIFFLALRSAFGGTLRRRIGHRAARFARGFERDAFAYLLALRLAPPVPFVIANIAPALFRVRMPTYLGATILGILPLIAIFAGLGEGVDEALAHAAGHALDPSDLITPRVTIALAVLMAIAVLAPVVKRFAARKVVGLKCETA